MRGSAWATRDTSGRVTLLTGIAAGMAVTKSSYFGGNAAPKSTVDIVGSLGWKREVITSTDTLGDSDGIFYCNAASGAITLNLPASANYERRLYLIQKTDTSSNNITIDPDGSEFIDGFPSLSLTGLNQAVLIQCNGVGWDVIATFALGS